MILEAFSEAYVEFSNILRAIEARVGAKLDFNLCLNGSENPGSFSNLHLKAEVRSNSSLDWYSLAEMLEEEQPGLSIDVYNDGLVAKYALGLDELQERAE